MKKKSVIPYVILFFLSLFAELFLFNYKHWLTLGNHEISLTDLSPEQLHIGDAYTPNGDGTFSVADGEHYIQVTGLDLELKSAYFNVILPNPDPVLPVRTEIYQYVTDDGQRFEYSLPVRELWSSQPKSCYHTYHLYGNCTSLRFLPNIAEEYPSIVIDIRINPVIPVFFSFLRMAGLFAVLCLLWILRPSSRVYEISYLNLPSTARTILLVFLFLVHMGIFWKLAGLNPIFTGSMPAFHHQYQKLAESLLEGSVSLPEEPGEGMKSLDNPYDLGHREDILARYNETYPWDTAYYNGKYYVYFGVMPVILFYLPYHILTGGALANHIVIVLALGLLLLGSLGSIHEMIRKYFSGLSLGVWFLTTELFLLGSNLVYIAKRPDFYSIPIVTALALGMLGLWCFLKADREDGISLKYLAAGSLLTAMIAGCRPQLMLFAAFPVILFRKYLFTREFYKTKNGRRAVASTAVPVLVIAAFLMYYNYARFGSPFDFGSTYNLTTNDMRLRGWVWGRIPLGIFVYLFQPMQLITDFPFVEAIYTVTQYMGITIQEYTPGGILATHLFAWAALPAVILRKKFADIHRLPCLLSICSLISSFVIIVADTELSGVLWRYFNDFSLFIMLAALLSVWILLSSSKMANPYIKKWFIIMLIICFVLEILFQGTTLLIDTSESLMKNRPDLFAKIKYLVAFWL